MLIRQYRPDDFEPLREITVEAFDGLAIDQMIEGRHGLLNGTDWRSRKAKHVDADVTRDPEGIFVAEVDGEIVGYVSSWNDRETGIGHIPNIAVANGYRGQGIGRRLLEHVIQVLSRQGMSHVRIETLADNSVGEHLYLSLGFEEITRQIHFIKKL
jgi:ribosomal protein S18 acetylase RimI-like enzyme